MSGTTVMQCARAERFRMTVHVSWQDTVIFYFWEDAIECREHGHSVLRIIIIIIAFKGTVRDFLQSPHSAANCLQRVRSSGRGAIVCKSRATHRALIMCKCHVTCHLVRRDSSAVKFDRVEIAFI